MNMAIPSKVKELFNKQGLVAVGTASPEGVPNVVPILWKKILDDDTIILIDNFMKTTKENLQRNKNVCISFWDAKTEEAYKIKGTARYHTDGPVYNEGKKFIQLKKPDRVPKGVVEIKVSQIFDITPGPNAGKKIS